MLSEECRSRSLNLNLYFALEGSWYFVLRTMITTNSLPKENLHCIPNPLSKNNYFFISCSDGKFRRFGKKI
jgi:hypothetical protein